MKSLKGKISEAGVYLLIATVLCRIGRSVVTIFAGYKEVVKDRTEWINLNSVLVGDSSCPFAEKN